MMSDAASYRLFVAIPLPEQVKAELSRVQRGLRDGLPRLSASWVRPENMHLTLRFLGDVPALRVDDLVAGLTAAVSTTGSLDLMCEGLGSFPDPRNPRVLWAGLHDVGNRLTELSRRLDAAVLPFGAESGEKRFVGHITLARIRQPRRDDVERIVQALAALAPVRFGYWRAVEIHLIRSELFDGRSSYSTLARVALENT